LPLAQGKQLVALVQQEIVTAQSRDHDGTIREGVGAARQDGQVGRWRLAL
jgi:hypothetical protein